MAGTRNDTHYSQGYNLTPTSDPAASLMQMTPNTCQTINTSGSPNGSKTANPGSICQDQSGNLWVKQTGTGNTGWVLVTTSATDLHTAKFIVGDVTNGANYSTIQAAINAATSGNTIFIQTGTYTEDITMKAGVNLVGFNGDQGMWKKQTQFNTRIVGKITANYTGFCNISNLCLTTNGDNCVHVLGSGTQLTLTNNFIDVVDAVTGILVDNTATNFHMVFCFASTQNVGASFFSIGISAILRYCDFAPNASPVSSSLVTGGSLQVAHSSITGEIIASNAAIITGANNAYGTITLNDTSIALLDNTSLSKINQTSSGTSVISNCVITSGIDTAITLDTSSVMYLLNSTVNSQNASAISGAGTLHYCGVDYTNTSTITVASQIPLVSSNDAVKVVTPGAYPYTTIPQDNVILVDTSSARTINLNASPVTGQMYRIKDNVGSAAANNITITPASGNIDGAASYTMAMNWGSVDVCYSGTQWVTL